MNSQKNVNLGDDLKMDYYVNENIKNTIRIYPEQNRYGYFRYDMNENPEGLPEEFVKDILKEITPEFLSVYPEPDKFLKKYAKFLDVKFENLLAVNGSDMAIRYLLETFGEPEKEVMTVSPSFEMYRVNCSILGLKHVPVYYEKDLTIKIENILNAINENTRIVVLLNPNNPIGNVYTDNELKQVVSKAQAVGAIVIIDEAYHYFYTYTFLKYALECDNVIVLRTFSKLFSIAACRLGVIISNPKIINYVKRARLTFDVNSIALLFAERLIDNPKIIEELIAIENEGKAYILEALRNRGYECVDCRGNFIFVKPKHNAIDITNKLKREEKVLVHSYGNELLKDYIRVSVGSKKAMEIFFKAFLKVDL